MRNLSAISRGFDRDGEWRLAMEVGGVPLLRSLPLAWFLIRMNNYPQSITSIQSSALPKLQSPSPECLFTFLLHILLQIQPFSPRSNSQILLAFVPFRNVINHCQCPEWTYISSTRSARRTLSPHWMLNPQPIMWEIFHKSTRNDQRKIINFKTFKTMKDLWRMDNHWIRDYFGRTFAGRERIDRKHDNPTRYKLIILLW